MTTAAPHHRNLTCYKQYRCRLPECVERKRAYDNRQRRQQAYGRWQPFVDAEPVRQHIEQLRAAKVTLERIGELTGLPAPSIGGIIYQLGPTRPRRKHLRPETAAKILAVRPEHAAPGVIDATGTRRRLEALQVIGWPKKELAARLGINVSTPTRAGRQDVVLATTAYKVAALYERLRVLIPENHGITGWVADRCRRQAIAAGWHGPLAWDGNIDDPTAEPDVTEVADLDMKRDELAAHRREEIWLLHTACLSDEEIARRVGVSASTVHTIRGEIRTGKKRDRRKEAAA